MTPPAVALSCPICCQDLVECVKICPSSCSFSVVCVSCFMQLKSKQYYIRSNPDQLVGQAIVKVLQFKCPGCRTLGAPKLCSRPFYDILQSRQPPGTKFECMACAHFAGDSLCMLMKHKAKHHSFLARVICPACSVVIADSSDEELTYHLETECSNLTCHHAFCRQDGIHSLEMTEHLRDHRTVCDVVAATALASIRLLRECRRLIENNAVHQAGNTARMVDICGRVLKATTMMHAVEYKVPHRNNIDTMKMAMLNHYKHGENKLPKISTIMDILPTTVAASHTPGTHPQHLTLVEVTAPLTPQVDPEDALTEPLISDSEYF